MLTARRPALDGIRAVSVMMVLLFHAGFGWMRGGYLGVSIFFTLSGFLITSKLLSEHSATGTIRFGAFFARRLRRLLPASLLCLAFVIVATLLGAFDGVSDFRTELLGAALNVSNWVQLVGDDSYADIFTGDPDLASPLEHYWSLAIEEQFYLVWPVAVLLIARAARRAHPARHVSQVMVGMFIVSAAIAPLIAVWFGPDAAYWSTIARFPELLAGAALAAVMARPRDLPGWTGRTTLPALTGLIALGALLPSSSGPAYSGFMAPLALLSVLLIVGVHTAGPVTRVLSFEPLAAIGRVSYGLYLFHWPVFVLLRQRGWTLSDPGPFIVAVGVTGALAAASFLTIERWAQGVRWTNRSTIRVSALASACAVALVATMPVDRGFLEPNTAVLEAAAIEPDRPAELVLVAPDPDPAVDPDPDPAIDPAIAPTAGPTGTTPGSDGSRPPGNETSTTITAGSTTTTQPTAERTPPEASAARMAPLTAELGAAPNRPVRILTVGDSTAFYLGQALAEWSVANPSHARASLRWCKGCGFIVDGTITTWDAQDAVARSVSQVQDQLPRDVVELTPDVVVLMSTVNDLTNRTWTENGTALTPFDEEFVERMQQHYDEVTDRLLDLGVPHVVWILPPVPRAYWSVAEMGELARWDTMTEVITETASRRDAVTVVDLEGWMVAGGHHDDASWRPDGTHLTEASARSLAEQYLAPLLVGIATRAR